jgi:predicted methyltransferase
MSSIDLRASINALSDVITNRPPPLRVYDQIYMKLADMLLQTEVLSRRFVGKSVIFIGDGDAIALSLVHLSNLKLLAGSPKHVTVLDFDERVVNSINHFGRIFEIDDRIHAELYNVADPLPPHHWQAHDAFYTNPPWGASNDGASVCSFVGRGVEAMGRRGIGCIVIGDHPNYPWTHRVQFATQRYLMERGFRVSEMLPQFHSYHLDDDPDLTSCCMVARRDDGVEQPYSSGALPPESWRNFYGADSPLRIRYIRDLTNGGKLASKDVRTEPF